MAAPMKDRKGRKVNPAKLPQETAKAGRAAPRPWKYSSVANGLTPSKLASILKKADDGDFQDLISLASEIERKDSHIGAQLRTRRLALAGLPWVAEAATDSAQDVQIAEEVQAIARSYSFSSLVFDLLDSIFKPFSACEIIWGFGEKWIPQEFIWRDQRHFRVDPEDGRTLLLRTAESQAGEPLEPWKWIIHTPRMFSGPLVTGGLVRPCSVAYSIKTLGLSAWAAYMELFGIPLRVGTFPAGTSEEDKDTLIEAIQALGSEGSAVYQEGMNIDIKDSMGSGTGSQIHERLCDWCDRQVSKAILGQTLTADTGGGSYAQGSIHNEIRRAILVADAVDLAATLQRDLIEPYVRINYGEEVALPVLRCETSEPEDRAAFVAALTPLVDRGLTVEQSVVRDRLGIPAPADGAEVLQPSRSISTGTSQ